MMHTASASYAPPTSHSASHYAYGGAHQRFVPQWESSSDPRQPRKPTKLPNESRPYSRTQDRTQYSAVKPETAASVQSYDNWGLGYQNLDQQGGGYELVGSGGESNSQYWFQGNTPRHEQEYDAPATGGEVSPNYAMYGSSRTTNVGAQDACFGQHDTVYSPHHAQYDDGRSPRGTSASPLQARKLLNSPASGPWSELTDTDRGVIAAQQCLDSLFPELLVEGVAYSGISNDMLYGRESSNCGDGSAYYEGPYRLSNNDSTRPSSRSRGSSKAHESYQHHSRPLHSPALEPGNSSSRFEASIDLDFSDDASDSDIDSGYPHVVMRISTSPKDSVDTPPGSGTPITPKYPSPELMDLPMGTSRPQHQHLHHHHHQPHQHHPQQQYYDMRSPRKACHSSSSSVAKRVVGPRSNGEMPPPESLALITLENYDQNDAWLVHFRDQNMSYKQIKLLLNLDEAESTLRGRYRTLIKPKNERLRKPVWQETDNRLLLECVNPDLPNIKWKQVSDQIVNNGGSYRFGSSTCKKQYLALVAEGRARPLSESAGAGKRSKQDQQQMQTVSQQQQHHHYYSVVDAQQQQQMPPPLQRRK